MTRRLAVAWALVAGIALAACGGGSSSPASSGSTPAAGSSAGSSSSSGPGTLILTRPKGIAQLDLASRDEKMLIPQPTPDTFLLDPAVSPDGASLAYVVQPPPKVQGTTYDAGSDVWVANRDGSGAHAVFTHVHPNQLVRFPQWLDAGHLLAVVQEPAQKAGTTTVTYVLERIDVATGQRARLIEGALTFGISPDRTHVVYTDLVPSGGETLNAAAVDGSGTRVIVGADQNLLPFNSPRYSPDGSTIAFTSADQTGARADLRYVTMQPSAANPGRALDGLPEDVWTVPATGGTARRVAKLKEDLPALTWGRDNKHLYVLGMNGLSDVNLSSGAVTRIAAGSFHGEITWAP
ncbi:MAG: TolB family protein [Dehalococcoidia bacterium]